MGAETDRQKTIKSGFSSYKGNSRKGNRTNRTSDGSDRLAAYKEATGDSNRDTKHADESPSEYRENAIAEKTVSSSESTQSSGSGSIRTLTAEEQNQQNLTPVTPTPIKPDYMKKTVSSNESVSPHDLYGSDPTQITSIHAKNTNTEVRQVNDADYLGEESTPLAEEVKISLSSQMAKGQSSSKDVKISNLSQSLIDVGDNFVIDAQEFQDTAKTKYGEKDIIMREITPRLVKSVAGASDMFLRVPAGIEVAYQKPELFPTAIAVAGLGLADYTISGLKEDPAQLVSDYLVFSELGSAAGKAGNKIKSKTPAIGTGEQGILLKNSIADTPKAPEILDSITVGEYKGQAFGQDVFVFDKITEKAPETGQAGTVLLIGETKKGLTDVYTPITAEQAGLISKNFYTSTRNIKTQEGSFLEVEITGEMQKSNIKAGDNIRVSTSEPELIGDLKTGENIGQLEILPRLEKRVSLTKGTISESNIKLLGEAPSINAEGRVIVEMDDIFGNPAEMPANRLNPGHEIVSIQRPRRSLMDDTSGLVYLDGTSLSGYKLVEKPRFIGEMPAMNVKSARVKENFPAERVGDLDMQKLYDEAVNRGKDPVDIENIVPEKLYDVERQPGSKSGRFRGIAGMPSSMSDLITDSITLPDIMRFPDFLPGSTPDFLTDFKPHHKTVTETKTPDVTKVKDVAALALEEMPRIRIPELDYETKKKKTTKKRKSRKTSWKYDRLVNDWQNPLDIEVKF
jgi:hypothetical protein